MRSQRIKDVWDTAADIDVHSLNRINEIGVSNKFYENLFDNRNSYANSQLKFWPLKTSLLFVRSITTFFVPNDQEN